MTLLSTRGWRNSEIPEHWKLARVPLLRVPGGVQHGVRTHLHAFWIIRESIDITMLKPYIFWNLTSIVRHCHCSSDTLTHCSEMPASCNGQLQMQHQVTACVILTTLQNRLRCHSPGIHKRAISTTCHGRNFYFLFLEKIIWFLIFFEKIFTKNQIFFSKNKK